MTAGNGLIETLWAGFVAVHRRPGLLLIPLFLDLLMFLGPAISAAPLADVAGRAVEQWAAFARAEGDSVPAEQVESAVESMNAGIEALRGANFVNVVGWLMPGQLGYRAEIDRFTLVPEAAQLPALLTVLIALGVFVAGLYYSFIGNSVRPGASTATEGLSWVPLNSLRFSLWVMLTAAALAFSAIPFLIVVGIIGLLSQALAALLFLITGALLMVMSLMLSFVPSAIFAGRLGPVRAAVASILIIRRFPSDSLLFLGVVWTLMIGWPVVWGLINSSVLGGLAAIVGHSYLVTGLVSATMLFFLSKYEALLPAGQNVPAAS